MQKSIVDVHFLLTVINPFTPGTFTHDNPPIPWDFWPKNLRARTREVNHMRSKAKDKIKFPNKLPFEVE